jgi:hypothetical protein
MTPGARLGVGALLVVAPVFWVGPVQSMDVPSHTYNAWLAQLIRQGELPGLWIEPMWTNSMFDRMLDVLLGWFSYATAEQAAMGVTVLVLAAGLSLWIRAAAGRFPWELSPLLLAAVHGTVTQAGFCNFMLSLGFGGAAGAALLAGGRRGWLAAPAGLIGLVANPAGATMMLALSVYVGVARRVSGGWRWVWFGAGVLSVAGLAVAIRTMLPVWPGSHLLAALGVTTLTPYRFAYLLVAVVYLGVVVYLAIAASQREGRGVWTNPVAQALAIAVLACMVLPSGVLFPGQAAYFAYIGVRIGLAVMVVTLAWLGAQSLPRRGAWIGSGVTALVYFGLLFSDHLAFRGLDESLRRLALRAPAGARVVLPLAAEGYLLEPMLHGVDRACIGHCSSYFNYEPSSRVFRVRSSASNGIVEAERSRILEFENGETVVRADDLPLYLIVVEDGRPRVREAKEGEVLRRARVPLEALAAVD